MSGSNPVLWSTDDRGVASVVLNRPERNNAYDDTLIAGIHAAMDALAAGTLPRVVVISGAGKHFQAGADLSWLKRVRGGTHEENVLASRDTAMAVDRLNRLPIPTVALVQGFCVGGGTGVLAACDVVIAAENARFAISEVRWGLTAAIIIPQLNDAIGARQVRRYALTGERFDANEARRIGLVHEVVPDAELAAAGERIVAALLENAPTAIAETKAAVQRHSEGTMSEAILAGLIEEHALKRQSAEADEGLTSFGEKRSARWTS